LTAGRIASRDPQPGGYVIISYRKRPWEHFVTVAGSRRCAMRHKGELPGPHAHATYRRAILTPFRAYGHAIMAAHQLERPPPRINRH
jgi:hypothetical protein